MTKSKQTATHHASCVWLLSAPNSPEWHRHLSCGICHLGVNPEYFITCRSQTTKFVQAYSATWKTMQFILFLIFFLSCAKSVNSYQSKQRLIARSNMTTLQRQAISKQLYIPCNMAISESTITSMQLSRRLMQPQSPLQQERDTAWEQQDRYTLGQLWTNSVNEKLL